MAKRKSDNTPRQSFADLLNTPADSVEAPPVTPEGTWQFTITSFKAMEPRDEDSPGVFLYGLKPTAAGEDVDPSSLEGFDMEGAMEWLRIPMRDRRDQYRVRKFLEAAGVDLSGGVSLIAASQASEGYEVMGYVSHAPSDDPERPYVRINQFGPIG